ncbi:MAG: OmpA family protein [Acidiferrobacterales bacterium]
MLAQLLKSIHVRTRHDGGRSDCGSAIQHYTARRFVLTVLMMLIGVSAPLSVYAVPPAPGDIVTNTAALTFTGGSANASATATTVIRTVSTTELLQYAVAAPSVYVPVPQCDSGGGYAPLAPPVVGGTPLAVPGNLGLNAVTSYAPDEAIFVRVTDADQNTDPLTTQTILIQISVAATGDTETVRLTETGINTGVFTGYIQATTAPVANDCLLSVVAGQPVTATYTDINDSADTSSANAPVASATAGIFLTHTSLKTFAAIGEVVPYQLELANTTGSGITGTVATISLPAGFRYQPGSTTLGGVAVGDPVISADGRSLTFTVGPVAAGLTVTLRYVVAITASSRAGTGISRADSVANGGIVSNNALAQILVEEEPIISRGLIMGRVMVGNCQAYPQKGHVGLRLRSKSIADRIDYSVNVNVSSIAVDELQIVIRLPEVLEYLSGTVKLDGVAISGPEIDGNTLRFQLGDRGANKNSVLTFSTRSQMRVFGEFSTRAYSEFSTRANAGFTTTDAVAHRTPVAVNRIKDYSRIVRPRFDSLSADLKQVDMQNLDDLAASLAGSAVKRIYIIGHADVQPIRPGKDTPFKNNEALALARANRVASYLDSKMKLGAGKFEVSSQGDRESLYYSRRLEGRTLTAVERLALNRRVEVLVEVEGQETETRFLVSKSDSGLKSAEFFAPYDSSSAPSVGKGIPGAKGIRLYLEDGQFVETDDQGMFHFDGLRPGTHVVQIDTDSLPDNLEVDLCENNTRFAGTAYSRFVDIKAGSLWRADFYLKRKAPANASGAVGLQLQSKLDRGDILFTLTANGDSVKFKKRRLLINLPEGLQYIPGSSRLDGARVADPVLDAGVYVFRMADIDNRQWRQSFSFRAKGVQSQEGEYATFAYMMFETLNGRQHRSSVVENTLLRQAPSVRRFIYEARFEGLSVDLSERDQQKLDGIIDYLRDKSIRNVYVAAYSDDTPIPPEYRDRYTDNYELTSARARKIGKYLGKKLRLRTRQLRAVGLGPDEPVASNDTVEGRRRNHRVELFVTLENEKAPHAVKIKQGDSKLQIAGVVNSTPYPEKTPDVPVNNKTVDDPLEEGVLNIRKGQRIAQPVIALRLRLDSRLKPDLRVDGVVIPNAQIGFKQEDKTTGKTTYTYIGVNLGNPGAHRVTLKGLDPFGNARLDQTVDYIRTSEIVEIRVLDTNGNVADGKTPVKIRVQLLDKNGDVINSSVVLKLKDSELAPYQFGEQLPELRRGADAVEVTAGGEILFEPVSTSGTRTGKLFYNNVRIDFRTYIKPVYRDWIMVGIAEGTMAYKTLSGNMQNLSDADLTDDFFQDGRLAFFAKGKIKGKYLLSIAYDSAKKAGVDQNGLFQQLNPDKYYTLYGDGTEQRAEAASTSKLFLKLEGDQFYTLFGDYNTGLTVTELSRYSRSLTGLKAEYKSKRFNINAFVSDTGNAFIKDEIAGDGTSGLYQLSNKKILLNSDKVRIETRDRFQSQVVLESRQLVRYIDYNLDPLAGTIYFKEPIYSRDQNLNPIYIVAEYELESGVSSLSAGGRVGVMSKDEKHEVGATVISQGTVGAEGRLLGVDGKFRINEKTEVRAEIASSEDNTGGTKRSGSAYVAEITYRSKKADIKAYARQHEPGFGIGQQSNAEIGTQKTGLTGKYYKSEKTSFIGEVFHNVNLTSGATRDVINGEIEYKWSSYTLTGGYRFASDANSGTVYESNLITGSIIRSYFDNRLKFRANTEVSVDGSSANPDYPNRIIAGTEYLLTPKSSVFAEQELTFGTSQDSSTTRVGIKSSPWKNAVIGSTVESKVNENGARVFTTTGLTQGYDVNPNLRMDFGLERVQTLQNPGDPVFDPDVPPASGTRSQDFTAVSTGATYKKEKWSTTGRVEFREGEQYDKIGVLLGFYRKQSPGFGLSGSLQHFNTDEATGNQSSETSMKFAVAYRPTYSKWIVLDKLELANKQDLVGVSDTRLQKIVNNISANYMFNRTNQITMHYGYKYVIDTIDTVQYNGSTQFIGSEYRHDFRKNWDMGIHASALQSQIGNNLQYSYGLSVGYSFARNTWISFGYNFDGFIDDDFTAAGYTAAGPYIKIRFGFDQKTSRAAMAWWEKRRGVEQPANR